MVAIATIHKAQPEKQPYSDQIAWLKIPPLLPHLLFFLLIDAQLH